MLRDAKEMVGLTIGATDGEIGYVSDLYFDDEAWVIRYLVVETGTWLSHRKVLVSPVVIGEPNWNLKRLPARLTLEQVRNSPDIDTDKPVSRRHEVRFCSYYGYPCYWGYSAVRAAAEYERHAQNIGEPQHDDPHLHSCKAVTGYHIHAVDGEIGHVQGMLIDEESWVIRYLVVISSNWWPGHQVLMAPESITDVSWLDRMVVVDMRRQAIQQAPPYDRALFPDRPGETHCWQYDTLSSLSPRVNSGEERQSERGGSSLRKTDQSTHTSLRGVGL